MRLILPILGLIILTGCVGNDRYYTCLRSADTASMSALEFQQHLSRCNGADRQPIVAMPACTTACELPPGTYANTASSGPSLLQRIFTGMAAAGQYGTANSRNSYGLYGVQGPSWSEFNYTYQLGILSPAQQLRNQEMQLQNQIQNHQLQMQRYQHPTWTQPY